MRQRIIKSQSSCRQSLFQLAARKPGTSGLTQNEVLSQFLQFKGETRWLHRATHIRKAKQRWVSTEDVNVGSVAGSSKQNPIKLFVCSLALGIVESICNTTFGRIRKASLRCSFEHALFAVHPPVG